MLRVIVAAIIVLVALVTVRLTPVSAHRGLYQVNAGNGLNLRTGPGGTYRRLYTMPNGTIVKARGHRGSWMYLTDLTTGTTGWAFLSYLIPMAGATQAAPSSGYCLTNYWGEWVCAPGWIADAIRSAAAAYGIAPWWLFALAACESSFNPWAYNPASGVSGLMQFQPSTFSWQGGTNLWSVWDQSYIAAKMMANGLGYHFHCLQLLGW